MIRCIYLDMDGVLCDMHRHVFRLFDLTAPQIEEACALTDGWDAMPEAINTVRTWGPKVHSHAMWERVSNQGERFWAEMPWTRYGLRILKTCEAFAPVVLMSTPTNDPASAAGKKAWINRELRTDYRFALTNCKHHFAHPGAVLVDDAKHNCDKFVEHDGRAFLWPQPWNGTPEATLDDVDKLRECLEAWS